MDIHILHALIGFSIAGCTMFIGYLFGYQRGKDHERVIWHQQFKKAFTKTPKRTPVTQE